MIKKLLYIILLLAFAIQSTNAYPPSPKKQLREDMLRRTSQAEMRLRALRSRSAISTVSGDIRGAMHDAIGAGQQTGEEKIAPGAGTRVEEKISQVLSRFKRNNQLLSYSKNPEFSSFIMSEKAIDDFLRNAPLAHLSHSSVRSERISDQIIDLKYLAGECQKTKKPVVAISNPAGADITEILIMVKDNPQRRAFAEQLINNLFKRFNLHIAGEKWSFITQGFLVFVYEVTTGDGSKITDEQISNLRQRTKTRTYKIVDTRQFRKEYIDATSASKSKAEASPPAEIMVKGQSNGLKQVISGRVFKFGRVRDLLVSAFKITVPAMSQDQRKLAVDAEIFSFQKAMQDIKTDYPDIRGILEEIENQTIAYILKNEIDSQGYFPVLFEEKIESLNKSENENDKRLADELKKACDSLIKRLPDRNSLARKYPDIPSMDDKIKKEQEHIGEVLQTILANYATKLARAKKAKSRVATVLEGHEMFAKDICGNIEGQLASQPEGQEKTARYLVYRLVQDNINVVKKLTDPLLAARTDDFIAVGVEILEALNGHHKITAREDNEEVRKQKIEKEISLFNIAFNSVFDNVSASASSEGLEEVRCKAFLEDLKTKIPDMINKYQTTATDNLYRHINAVLPNERDPKIAKWMYIAIAHIAESMEAPFINGSGAMPEESVLVAKELKQPYELFLIMERYPIKAIVVEEGTPTSHATLLATNEGKLVITGSKIFDKVSGGEDIMLRGRSPGNEVAGEIVVNPTEKTSKIFLATSIKYHALDDVCSVRKKEPAVTKDGKTVLVRANADKTSDVRFAIRNGADGTGLNRLEWIALNNIPKSSRQAEDFRIAASIESEGKPVLFRTHDVEPDKQTKLPPSKVTGCRYYFDDENGKIYIREQLRALFCAFAGKRIEESSNGIKLSDNGQPCPNIRVMFPQVSTKTDVDQLLALVEEIKHELISLGVRPEQFNGLKIGAMIETPTAVNNLDYLAEKFDFISYGTNHLTENTFGVSRDVASQVHYFTDLQPEILVSIKKGVVAAKKKGIEVGVCGQLGSYKKFIVFLISLQDEGVIFYPSVPATYIPEIKEFIRNVSVEECKAAFAGFESMDAKTLNAKADELVKRVDKRIESSPAYKEALEKRLSEYNKEHPTSPITIAELLANGNGHDKETAAASVAQALTGIDSANTQSSQASIYCPEISADKNFADHLLPRIAKGLNSDSKNTVIFVISENQNLRNIPNVIPVKSAQEALDIIATNGMQFEVKRYFAIKDKGSIPADLPQDVQVVTIDQAIINFLASIADSPETLQEFEQQLELLRQK